VSHLRHFWTIAADAVPRCRTNPAYLEDVLTGSEEGAIDSIHLDDAWDVIHFLISAHRAYPDVEDEPDTVHYDYAIRGAKVHKGLDLGHGAAGVSTPEEVRGIVDSLSVLTEEDLRDRLDPEAMKDADVFPEAWVGREWAWIWERFQKLRNFYLTAAAEGYGVATWVVPPVAAEK